MIEAVCLVILVLTDTLLTSNVRTVRDESLNLSLVNQKLVQMQTALVSEETGQRGYDLTGDPAFLTPFDQGSKDFTQLSSDLVKLVESLPVDRAIVEESIALGQEWHDVYGEPQVKERKSGAVVPVTALLQGKSVMASFNAKVDEGISQFNGQIRLDSRRSGRFSQFLLALHVMIIVIQTGILVLLVMSYLRSQQRTINEDKMRLVGELAASMAHEIKNPIQVSRGFMQLVKEHTRDEKLRRYASHSIHALDESHHVLTDYLSLAKPASGVRRIIRLSDIINDVANLLTAYGIQYSCQIDVQVGEDCELYTDVDKLKQVLINLGKNGIESTVGSGRITFAADGGSDGVSLTVQDTGAGMTGEQLSRLGLPFYSTKEQGTGLGMMVVYRLIEELDAKMEIKSALGKGTSVEITLPESAVAS